MTVQPAFMYMGAFDTIVGRRLMEAENYRGGGIESELFDGYDEG
jgi:hypothetical protein